MPPPGLPLAPAPPAQPHAHLYDDGLAPRVAAGQHQHHLPRLHELPHLCRDSSRQSDRARHPRPGRHPRGWRRMPRPPALTEAPLRWRWAGRQMEGSARLLPGHPASLPPRRRELLPAPGGGAVSASATPAPARPCRCPLPPYPQAQRCRCPPQPSPPRRCRCPFPPSPRAQRCRARLSHPCPGGAGVRLARPLPAPVTDRAHGTAAARPTGSTAVFNIPRGTAGGADAPQKPGTRSWVHWTKRPGSPRDTDCRAAEEAPGTSGRALIFSYRGRSDSPQGASNPASSLLHEGSCVCKV